MKMKAIKNKSLTLYNNIEKSFFLHEQLLDALPSIIFITDKNDRIVYTNKKFTKIINIDAVSENYSMKEIVNRQDWNNWNENLFKLSNIDDEESSIFNIRFNSNAAVKYFKLEGKVFKRDEQNKPRLYFFTAEDVTQQFEDENSCAVENDSVNWKNFTCKTSAEKKLELAVKDLGRSNKDLEEFAYVASHDLQEPLRKITSFSSRLDSKFSDKLGDEGKLFIQKINTSANGMKQLIDNLLQISRTVQYKQPFEKTDLNNILKQVLQNLDLKIEEGKVKIIQDNLPVIDALPSLMVQLFSNLLCNAIKFSSKHQSAVINIYASIISAEEKKAMHLCADETYYKISFKDNGIGFSQESATQIFKIFCRLNGKTEYPGTGIGLAICSTIVQKHNGLIWAESEPGSGAIFNILVPKTQD